MKLPRKYKKQLINFFGLGTYKGIINGYLSVERTENNKGTVIKWTGKPYTTQLYNSGQYHPYIKIPTCR